MYRASAFLVWFPNITAHGPFLSVCVAELSFRFSSFRSYPLILIRWFSSVCFYTLALTPLFLSLCSHPSSPQSSGQGGPDSDTGGGSPGHSENMHPPEGALGAEAKLAGATADVRRHSSRNNSDETQGTRGTSGDKSDMQVEAQGAGAAQRLLLSFATTAFLMPMKNRNLSNAGGDSWKGHSAAAFAAQSLCMS